MSVGTEGDSSIISSVLYDSPEHGAGDKGDLGLGILLFHWRLRRNQDQCGGQGPGMSPHCHTPPTHINYPPGTGRPLSPVPTEHDQQCHSSHRFKILIILRTDGWEGKREDIKRDNRIHSRLSQQIHKSGHMPDLLPVETSGGIGALSSPSQTREWNQSKTSWKYFFF